MSSFDITKLHAYLQRMRHDVENILVELISYRSTVDNEHDVVNYLYQRLLQEKWNACISPVPEMITADVDYTIVPSHVTYEGRPNIFVDIPGSGSGRSLVLNSHCDVVPAPDDMFTATITDDVVYGRGACDAKGQVVTIWLVLNALRALGVHLRGDLQAQFVIEEEAGGNGALAAVINGMHADCAVVLEPTSLQMHPANRGAVWYRFTTSGMSVHMGKYWQGTSAIELMTELMLILKRFEKQLQQQSAGLALFPHTPSPVNVNIGQISGGDWPATVPAECSIEGGIAFLPNKDIPTLHNELLSFIEKEASPTLRQAYRFEFGRLHNEAYQTPADHPSVLEFHECVEDTIGPQPIVGWIASCDARLFAKRGQMPTITFGPGDLGDAHSLHEQIKVDDIISAAEIITKFAVNWCGAD